MNYKKQWTTSVIIKMQHVIGYLAVWDHTSPIHYMSVVLLTQFRPGSDEFVVSALRCKPAMF